MAQTLCIKCGSELEVSSYCQLCQQPLIFGCTSCEYITEEKVHSDCINAQVLSKPTVAKEAQIATTAAATTAASKPISNKNQEEAIVVKHQEEEIVKMPAYMKENQDDIIHPFVASSAAWQSLMSYWFNVYGEFLKSASKMNEDWYYRVWKPWLSLRSI
jgi:hypothetical protein